MALTLLELPVAILELVFQFMSGTRVKFYYYSRRDASCRMSKDHLDMRSVICAFCPVSSAARALVLGTPAFYRDYTCDYRALRRQLRQADPSRPAIVIGLRPVLTDHRLSSLLRAFPTASVQMIDVRGTGILAVGVIDILCACPMLRELDVGECAGLSMVELEVLLRSVRVGALQVKELEYMEICGSGTGLTWVGYRQQLSFAHTCIADIAGRSYMVPSGRAWWNATPETTLRRDLRQSEQLRRVGDGPSLRAAVIAVESCVRSSQHLRPLFTLGVHLCEHCHTSFVEYVPQDGRDKSFDTREEQLDFLRGYRRHTCQGCGKQSFLCMECASYDFHYCEFWDCKACFCTDCDGASFTAAWKAVVHGGSPAAWFQLQTIGTVYFRVADCREGDECETPQDWRIVCKPTTSPNCSLKESLCRRCGTRLCYRCIWQAHKGGITCEICKDETCCDLCKKTEHCYGCQKRICAGCGPVLDCDRCPQVKGMDNVMYPFRHCPDCCDECCEWEAEQVSDNDDSD